MRWAESVPFELVKDDGKKNEAKYMEGVNIYILTELNSSSKATTKVLTVKAKHNVLEWPKLNSDIRLKLSEKMTTWNILIMVNPNPSVSD